MTLTVRHWGKLLSTEDGGQAWDVIAVLWFDADEDSGPWGGIVETGPDASVLREQVLAGQDRYDLRLDDGREGMVRLGFSDFVADGDRPLTFAGVGSLARATASRMGAAHG